MIGTRICAGSCRRDLRCRRENPAFQLTSWTWMIGESCCRTLAPTWLNALVPSDKNKDSCAPCAPWDSRWNRHASDMHCPPLLGPAAVRKWASTPPSALQLGKDHSSTRIRLMRSIHPQRAPSRYYEEYEPVATFGCHRICIFLLQLGTHGISGDRYIT